MDGTQTEMDKIAGKLKKYWRWTNVINQYP